MNQIMISLVALLMIVSPAVLSRQDDLKSNNTNTESVSIGKQIPKELSKDKIARPVSRQRREVSISRPEGDRFIVHTEWMNREEAIEEVRRTLTGARWN